MQVLIAVIDDLFQFICKAVSGAVPYGTHAEKIAKPEQTLDSYQEVLQKIQKSSGPVVAQSGDNIQTSAVAENTDIFHVGEQYYIGVIGAYFYNDPVQAFDNALTRLEYGKSVRLVSVQGRWAQVRLAGTLGWVFKDSLVLQAEDVYPSFSAGVQYTAQQPQTVKLRACIDDEFGGARGEHDLSAAEYVHYRLMQKKRLINWADVRMRIPGTWQRKLRGSIGIHIGITPKTESVMEYVVDDIGHLAFVEAVFPDGSIEVSEIGKMSDSAYTEGVLQPDQWKELAPVFIEVE